MTGLHMLHVIGGMAINAYFWGPGAKLWKTDKEHFANRVENSGLLLALRRPGLDLPVPGALPSVGATMERRAFRRDSTSTSGRYILVFVSLDGADAR